jgi:hypothetical protein
MLTLSILLALCIEWIISDRVRQLKKMLTKRFTTKVNKSLTKGGVLAGPAIFKFGSGVDGTKSKLGPAVIADVEIRRFDEIEIAAIP